MSFSRTILVGDIHGCLDEFKELLNLVSYNKSIDDLRLVGDLIDRGPDSAGVVKFCKEQGFQSVKGNHEEKHLRHRKNMAKDGKSKVQWRGNQAKLHEELNEDDWAYLASFPTYMRLSPKLVVVHAGLRRGLPIEHQDDNDMIRMRYVMRDTGKMAGMKLKGTDYLRPATSAYWTELWDGQESVVYGHQPHVGVAVDESSPGVFCYGIDTGACFGRQLTAAVFTDLDASPQFAQVNARGEYAVKFTEGVMDE